MEMQLLAIMNSSITLQLILAVLVIVPSIALLWAKVKNIKLEEPVMETGRARGKLVLGRWDHESSDVSQVMSTELEEPVMETCRDKGRLALGKKDYKV